MAAASFLELLKEKPMIDHLRPYCTAFFKVRHSHAKHPQLQEYIQLHAPQVQLIPGEEPQVSWAESMLTIYPHTMETGIVCTPKVPTGLLHCTLYIAYVFKLTVVQKKVVPIEDGMISMMSGQYDMINHPAFIHRDNDQSSSWSLPTSSASIPQNVIALAAGNVSHQHVAQRVISTYPNMGKALSTYFGVSTYPSTSGIGFVPMQSSVPSTLTHLPSISDVECNIVRILVGVTWYNH